MDSEAEITTLIKNDLIEANNDGLSLTDTFRESIEIQRSFLKKLDDEDLREEISALVDDTSLADIFADIHGGHNDLFVTYRALNDTVEDRSELEYVQLLAILDQLQRPPAPSDGVPESFFAVHGDLLRLLIEVHPAAIVYVWRHECDPCDLVRQDLDELFEHPPDDLALFAVYGPDWAELLAREYDVGGGPTVLFTLNGTVDCRLVGAYDPDVLKREIETHRGIAHQG